MVADPISPLDEALTAIWQRMGEWRNSQNIPDRCATCKIFLNCHGGCRITAKACTGDCRGEDPWMDLPNVSDEWPTRAKNAISLDSGMTATFAKIFRWRHENGDSYLISSTRNNRNLTAINGQLFNFVKHLREILPLNLEDLAKSVRCDFADSEFQRVMHLLATREFVSLGRSERR